MIDRMRDAMRPGGQSNSRRIVMLLENFTYPQDTRVRNEAESLAAAGHRVLVLAPGGEGQPRHERLGGVEIRRYYAVWATGSPWSYVVEYGFAHLQLLALSLMHPWASGRWTLHFHGPPDTLALAGIVARLAGGTVVYDMHDSAPQLFAAKFGSSAALQALRIAQRAAIRCAHGVIVTNETQRELALEHRPSEEVAIVRNGPRLDEFPEPPSPRAGALNAPELIYVGTLDIQDGVLELPALLRQEALVHARLTVVGDGSLRERLRECFRDAGVENRVRFTGRVPHERVADLIAAADIAIDPAPGTELNHGSTMIKIAEYMAAGRPIVAYDLRETRRTAGNAALYAPCEELSSFAELVAALARDGELRLRLGREARAHSLGLIWEHSERRLLDFYERISRARR